MGRDAAGMTIEDLMRNTLANIARSELGWDAAEQASSMPDIPILRIFEGRIGAEFSRTKLAKAFMNWMRPNPDGFSALNEAEQERFKGLTARINASFE